MEPDNQDMNYHLTIKSANGKTGSIPVSTSSARTCPVSCPQNGAGCYARGGPLGMHWRAVTSGKRGVAFGEFLHQVKSLPAGTVWRHNQAGDLPGVGDEIDGAKLARLVAASSHTKAWTYTHKPVIGDSPTITMNRAAIRNANLHGFRINLSADNLVEADALADADCGPVVVIVPSDAVATKTPAGRRVIICPAQTSEVTCAQCQLCAKTRSVIIGFRAHGAARRKAEAVCAQS